MLATYSFLPFIQSIVRSSDIKVDLKNISLAGRVIALWPEKLAYKQKLRDALADPGELCPKEDANVIKLPNISASIPQLKDCIKELQDHGYKIPDYPESPSDDAEKKIQEKYKHVLGSGVNPVLREGRGQLVVGFALLARGKEVDDASKARAVKLASCDAVAHF